MRRRRRNPLQQPAPPTSGGPGPTRQPGTRQTSAAPPAPRQAAEKNDPLSERVLGDPNAPITILEYSSLTCPHCAAFHANTLPQLKKDYIDTGKVKLVFRDFPFDRAALQASMLARCSNPERYFGFLDVLFKSQNKWAGASDPAQALAQTGKLAGVGDQQFKECLANEALANKLIERRLEAEQKYQVAVHPDLRDHARRHHRKGRRRPADHRVRQGDRQARLLTGTGRLMSMTGLGSAAPCSS